MTRPSSPAIRALVVSALLLGTTLYLSRALIAESPPPRKALATLPMALGGWEGQAQPDFDAQVVGVLGVDDYLTRSYWRGEDPPIDLYIGYYQSQRQGDTIHSPLNCLPGSGWTPLETSRERIPIGSGPPLEVKRVLIEKGLDRQFVLYWYQSHGRVIASEYWGKIYTVLDAISMHRTDAALVRVITPLDPGSAGAQAAAQHRAVAFVQALFPQLRAYVPD